MSSQQPAEYGSAVANPQVDADWLAHAPRETILEPTLPIIDPHHHLWDRPGFRYLLPELLQDLNSGHDVRATIFAECTTGYRANGDVELRAVGETAFANAIGVESASGRHGRCRVSAGIIGYADLGLGDGVRRVLEAHIAAGDGRFRGIRQTTLWHESVAMLTPNALPKRPIFRDMLADAKFREGFAWLARHDLSYDSWLYHTQLPELADLARAFSDTRIVVGHVGGAARVGAFAGRDDEVFAVWKAGIDALAAQPNVFMKIGGLGLRLWGFDLRSRQAPASSAELAALWKPYVDYCLQAFGPGRCMFESNFPVDKACCSYATLWNAFKRLAAGYSAGEKADLFGGTAMRVYKLKGLDWT